MFSPEEKEIIAYVVFGILTIISLGTIGVSGFKLKTPIGELSTDQLVSRLKIPEPVVREILQEGSIRNKKDFVNF